MGIEKTPEQLKLQTLIHYDPITGIVTRLYKSKGAQPGPITNKDKEGYLRTKIAGQAFRLTTLIWMYMTGHYPAHFVDHINGKVDDNRWENLRLCTNQENQQNQKLRKSNNTGHKHVTLSKKGKYMYYRVNIKAGNKVVDTTFKTLQEAIVFAEQTRAELHSNFATSGIR